MPSKAIRRLLVPNSFHQELVRAMQAAGFTLMYPFKATTERDTYHNPEVQYAQETTHFFYLRNRGFLVHLSLAENVNEQGQYRSWWTGAVYLELDTHAMIEYEVLHICPQHEGPQFFMDSCEPLEHLMGNLDALLLPFQNRGGSRFLDDDRDSFGWTFEHSGALTGEQLVAMVEGLSIHFGPFLKPKLCYNFYASCFTNDYAWPGIRERFWGHFPTRLLSELVPGRIRGRESVRTQNR